MATDYKTTFLPNQLKMGDVLKNGIMYANAQQSLLIGPESAPNEAMIDDLARRGVEVRTSCEPSPEDITKEGYEADTAEALKYAGCTKEFYLAGDCDRTSSTIMSGTLQAFGRANLI